MWGSDHSRWRGCRSGPTGRAEVHTHAGFSLIEMLIVVALLLILTTMYWGPNSASRQRSLKASCGKNLAKLYIAFDIYATDHAGKFPEAAGARTAEEALAVLVPRYTSDTSAFVCPSSKDSAPEAESFKKGRISYAYYMGRSSKDTQPLMSDRQLDTNAKSPGQLAFSLDGKGPGNNHRKFGGNFLFPDGHVEQTPAKLAFPADVGPGVVLLNPR